MSCYRCTSRSLARRHDLDCPKRKGKAAQRRLVASLRDLKPLTPAEVAKLDPTVVFRGFEDER